LPMFSKNEIIISLIFFFCCSLVFIKKKCVLKVLVSYVFIFI
jgi:hypothetical protein